MEKAILAAGCFWGIEDQFRKVNGVQDTEVGYAGGYTKNPDYKQVCSGRTGHAEAVQLTFDPAVVSYQELLDIFWSIHDPTTPNRQGWDVGNQYRSAIFYLTPGQQKLAEKAKKKLEESGRFKNPIVTQIVPAGNFYRAEEYHQQYYMKKGITGSCAFPSM